MNGEIDPSIVTPGPAGALVVFLLAVSTYFIIRGVLKRIRRIPLDPPADNAGDSSFDDEK